MIRPEDPKVRRPLAAHPYQPCLEQQHEMPSIPGILFLFEQFSHTRVIPRLYRAARDSRVPTFSVLSVPVVTLVLV